MLALVAADCSYEEAATELDMSVNTPREHVRTIATRSNKSVGDLAHDIRSSLKKDREGE